MSRSSPNHREDTQGYIAGLPAERLTLPEPYLYKLLLEAKKVEDTAERRRQFKRLLVTRQMEEGITPPQVDQKELRDFMNPEDFELKMRRSLSLARILERHLEETHDFVESQRLAVLELFHREAPLRKPETDKAYFQNVELVSADFESLAKVASQGAGRTIKPEDLNTNHLRYSFTLTTGESLGGQGYFNRAAIALGMARTKREAQKAAREAIVFLKKSVGFEVREYLPTDEPYFKDSGQVRVDLETLASAASQNAGKTIQPNCLSVGRQTDVVFTLTTGESIKGPAYFGRAAKAFGKVEYCYQAFRIQKEILDLLKKTAGFEVVVIDNVYFNDPSKVRADLESLAAACSERTGKTIAPVNLNTRHLAVPFALTTGESIGGQSYLMRAAVALGEKENTGGSLNYKRMLAVLKQIAGYHVDAAKVIEYPATDEVYFKDSDRVRADLESLATLASEKAGTAIHPKDLKIAHMKLSFSLTTGETINGQTYFSRAAKALGKAKNNREAQRIQGEILHLLKGVAGFEVEAFERIDYPPTDGAYFVDSDKVRSDLESLAVAVSEKMDRAIQPNALGLGEHIRVPFTLTTGETVSGNVYLCRAAIALGRAKNGVDARKIHGKTLVLLKRIAAFEISPKDDCYFRDFVTLRADLESLAAAASEKTGKNIRPEDLNTYHLRFSFTVTTGDSMRGQSYLNRAAKALGKVRQCRDAMGMQKEILNYLKKLIGITSV